MILHLCPNVPHQQCHKASTPTSNPSKGVKKAFNFEEKVRILEEPEHVCLVFQQLLTSLGLTIPESSLSSCKVNQLGKLFLSHFDANSVSQATYMTKP